jgi:dTDP-4-amino-4,6-dideoxygalactose transaminase
MGGPAVKDVPLCDLTTQYRQIQSEIEAAISGVLTSGQVILGPETTALETEFAEYCTAKYALGCGSGTDALLLALHGFGIGEGDEVICPPFTFFATVGSIIRCGATPIFADIDPVSYNLDPNEVERRITDRTKAIMPVHLFGQCCDMKPLQELAKKHNLLLIEDSAQSFGAEYQGVKSGVLGDVACFSFYPSKNLGTYGDAGIVTTDNEAAYLKMKALRVHGMEPKYFHKYIGWNARIDAIHSAIIRVKMRYIDGWTTQRQEAVARYTQMIDHAGLSSNLVRPVQTVEGKHVYNQYTLRVEPSDRDAIVKYLRSQGVSCEIYYPLPLHLQECLTFLNYREGDFPISELAARSVLSVPMFPEISEQQQERVVSTLSGYFQQYQRSAA